MNNTYYDNFFQTSLQKHEDELTDMFKKSADAHGWPEKIVSDIKVQIDDGNLALQYGADNSKEIDTLEYGGPGAPARAAIRKFLDDADAKIESILAMYSAQTIFKRNILP